MAIFLSKSDRAIIQDLIVEVRGMRQNQPQRSSLATDTIASEETYVALPQSAGGIPALTPGSPAIPGSAQCDIYRITDTPELLILTEYSELVYNLSTTVIPQQFVLIKKTNFDNWVATTVTVGTGTAGGEWIVAGDSGGDVTIAHADRLKHLTGDATYLATVSASSPDNRITYTVTPFTPLMAMCWTGTVSSIPTGWAIMDGTANSTGNGGSGIDMRDFFVRAPNIADTGTGNAPTNACTGGTTCHDHGAVTGTGGEHAHAIGRCESGVTTIANFIGITDTGTSITGIEIAASGGHTHSIDSGSGGVTTESAGGHSHTISKSVAGVTVDSGTTGLDVDSATVGISIASSGEHTTTVGTGTTHIVCTDTCVGHVHTVSKDVSGVTVDAGSADIVIDGCGGHSHTMCKSVTGISISGGGTHTHSTSTDSSGITAVGTGIDVTVDTGSGGISTDTTGDHTHTISNVKTNLTVDSHGTHRHNVNQNVICKFLECTTGDTVWCSEDTTGASPELTHSVQEDTHTHTTTSAGDHSHVICDVGHTHGVTSAGTHNHDIVDAQHSHTIASSGAHFHSSPNIAEPNSGSGHDHAIETVADHTHAVSSDSHTHGITEPDSGSGHNHTLSTNASHNHTIADGGHNHIVTGDGAHTHSAGNVTDPGHIHSVTDAGHTHTITEPDSGSGHTHTTDTVANHTHTITDTGHLHTLAGSGTHTHGTGDIVEPNAGLGHSHSIVDPAHNHDIREPDVGTGSGHFHLAGTEASHTHSISEANHLNPWKEMYWIEFLAV